MNVTDSKNINYFFGTSETKNGVQFDPNEDVWKLIDANRRITINYNRININTNYMYGLKNTFKWYFENYSARHTENMYKALLHLSLYLSAGENDTKVFSEISEIELINYRGYLGKEREWYLGSLSGFLKKWYKMGSSCLTKEAYGYLEETKFKSNRKGEAVLTMDPIKGPFSDLELESIQTAINNSYAKNEIKTGEYILV